MNGEEYTELQKKILTLDFDQCRYALVLVAGGYPIEGAVNLASSTLKTTWTKTGTPTGTSQY